MANVNQNAVTQGNNNMGVSYEVGGETIKLSFNTVKNYLVRGNGNVSDQELILFMNLCKFQKLNPFMNEAYLVKYSDSSPAQNVVGKEAYMKRAEEHPQYDGFKAGLILNRGNEIIEVEGAFSLKDDVILGGWAEVYRKDRKYPITVKVNFDEYNKAQSTWKQMPKTMIRKVAIVQALREAFPISLANMYTEEEIQDAEVIDEEQKVNSEIKNNANKQTVKFDSSKAFDLPHETETQAKYNANTANTANTANKPGFGTQMGIDPNPDF